MGSLYKQLGQYFDTVLNTEDFVIAVDATGMYMFHEARPAKDVVARAEKLLEILALKEEEAKLIFVDEGAGSSYDSFAYETSSVGKFVLEAKPSRIEDLVRKMTGVREIIFTPEDVDSIVDCFTDVKRKLTEFQQELIDLGLDEEQAVAIEAARPDSINDLIELGCPYDLVEDVYEAFKDYYVQTAAGFEKLDTNNYVTIEKNMKSYRAMGCVLGVCSIAAWCVGFLLPVFELYCKVGAVLLAVVAMNSLSKANKLTETSVARIGFVVCGVLVLIITVPTVGVFIVRKVIELMQGLSQLVITNPFENLHW